MNRTQGPLLIGTVSLAAASCATAGAPSKAPPSFTKEKISTDDEPHLPASFPAAACGASVSGAYRLCLSPQGAIRSVEAVQSIPDADAAIVDTLKRWRYKPPGLPFCFVQNLQFQIECRKPPAPQSATAAAAQAGPGDNPEHAAGRDSAPAAAEIPWPEQLDAARSGRPPIRIAITQDDRVSFEQGADARSTWVQRVHSPQQILWRFALPAEALTAAALLIDKDSLFIAHYSAIASGMTLHALDLNSGRELWVTRAHGLGPIDHSQYASHVALAMVRGYLIAFGRESAGRYIEVFDPQSGQVLSTHARPAAP